eukprot:1541487-Pyramimonas_sp.AAC.1
MTRSRRAGELKFEGASSETFVLSEFVEDVSSETLVPHILRMGFSLLADRAGGTQENRNALTSSHSDPVRLTHHADSLITQTLITQIHSSLIPTHHPGSLITQTHSSLGLSHDSDSSLITQTPSSLRLTHHSESLISQIHSRSGCLSAPKGSGGG